MKTHCRAAAEHGFGLITHFLDIEVELARRFWSARTFPSIDFLHYIEGYKCEGTKTRAFISPHWVEVITLQNNPFSV